MKTIRIGLLAGLLTLQPLLVRAQAPPPPLSLSLREAVRMALSAQGNLAIDLAGQSIRTAEARLREARAADLPDIETVITGQNQVLNLSALGFEAVRLPVTGFSFPRSVGPFNTVDARLHVRQSLIDVASTRRSQALRAGVETARMQTDEIRDQVAVQVAKLYLSAVRSVGAVPLAQAMVASAELTLQEVVNRNAAGKALGIDVARARVRVAAEKSRLAQAQLECRRTAFDLLSALNRDLDTPLDMTEPLTFAPEETLPMSQALAIALKSRSEIVVQRQRLEAARLRDVSIDSERLPSLAGYADLGSLGTTVPNSVGTYNAGISLRIPVFDGGRRNSRREETRSVLRQEELRAVQLEKEVELEIRQALLKLDIARAQVEISAGEVEIAKDELAHRKRRNENGLDGQLDVAQATLNMARADDGQNSALYVWNEARIELMHAMGTLRSRLQ